MAIDHKRLVLIALLFDAMITLVAVGQATESDLASRFRTPPDAARPWVYWFWMNGNITREGITADLEAMRRVGIGGVLIMEINPGVVVGPVGFMGPQWRELFQHTAAEAQTTGIGSEHEQRRRLERQRRAVDQARAIHAASRLERDPPGGRPAFEGRLPQPPTTAGFYRDIAVLAMPTPPGELATRNMSDAKPRLTTGAIRARSICR